MSRFRLLFFAGLFCSMSVSQAIVDPVPADIPEQDWMANVLIKGERSKNFSLLCKGSLIHEYWVLSSTDCLTDALEIIHDFVGSDAAEFAVALGNLGGFFRVEERITSPDGNSMLLRLDRPSDNKPIDILYRTPAQLEGVQVRIFGNESSASFADNFYNPTGQQAVSCEIEGKDFFSDGRMCYVTSTLDYSIFPLMARGRVIDPLSADAPDSPLNAAISPDTSGDRFYVDFSENNSHPCHEDLGAPVIATVAGEPVQVGLLVAAGMPTRVPLCNGSFYNHMISLKAQQDFIEQSIAKGEFAQRCPSKAELKFEQLSGSSIRLYWSEIDKAEGYKILATAALGYEPIQAIDLGDVLELSVELELGTTYSLALQGYNSQCTGKMSRPISIVFDS